MQKLSRIKEFMIRWSRGGSEKQDTSLFWIEFVQNVLGITDVYGFLEFEKPVFVSGMFNGPKLKSAVPPSQCQLPIDGKPPKTKGTKKSIDAYISSARVIIEQKSSDIDLDRREQQSDGEWLTPLEQAQRYNTGLRASEQARYIITCNFKEFRIYDLDHQDTLLCEDYEPVKLEELDKNLALFDRVLVHAYAEELRRERELSEEAARLMARLRDELEGEFALFELNRDHLTVLMVRLLFCMYAEDATLFQPNQFRGLLDNKKPDQETGEFREALEKLFDALNTPVELRKKTLAGCYAAFPYVNGGLFSGEIDIPFFSEESKRILLDECCSFQWSAISPALFGALFESVLSPREKHDGGMHYTSIENIRKVTGPLFLDALERELQKSGNSKARLLDLQSKISEMKFLDPACGSGNFLTQSYIDVRRLENRILERLVDPRNTGQGALQVDEAYLPKVSIGNFYGIEINDFAVHVAETAMQIAKHQMDVETSVVLGREIDTLPLTRDTSIVQANALCIDWNEVLPANECSYVLGNPPFLGARNQNKQQKAELMAALGGSKNSGNVDYVAAWFYRAADYAADHNIRCAFVSTNSICQGEQVANIWKPLWDGGIRIDFAHDTFRWRNEASEQAHVFVSIVGFSRLGGQKRLFQHPDPDAEAVESTPRNINAYLADAPDVFLGKANRMMCNAPKMSIGSQPIDNGNYLFKPDELEAFLAEEPGARPFIHPWMGSEEFIKGKQRYVLWLGDVTPRQLMDLPRCRERVAAVREYRLASKRKQTLKAAETPAHFGTEIITNSTSILVPKVSSERRFYMPIGFVGPETFCSDLVFLIPDATLYHFGVLQSRLHMAWMRTVCGRLKSDYRYSAGVVYNNFPWPGATPANIGQPVEELVSCELRNRIEAAAQAVLDERSNMTREGFTIADMYNPDSSYMFEGLMSAHKDLDREVERSYGFKLGLAEPELAGHLLRLYAHLAE